MNSTQTRHQHLPSSESARFFLDEHPEIAQHLSEQQDKGDFDENFTPSVVEIKFSGLTYLRYEDGALTASRECSKGYKPPYWSVYFNEEEMALFVLGEGEVLLDRTTNMAKFDDLLGECSFSESLDAALLTNPSS